MSRPGVETKVVERLIRISGGAFDHRCRVAPEGRDRRQWDVVAC